MASFALAWRLGWRQTANHAVALFLALVMLAVINFRYHLRPEIFAVLFVLVELNPLGYKLFSFAWDLRRWEVMRAFVTEWTGTFSPIFMHDRAFPAYAYLLALCAAVLVAYRRRIGATEALLLAVFAAASADRHRYIVF